MKSLREEILDWFNSKDREYGKGINSPEQFAELVTDTILSKIEKRIDSKDNIERYYSGEFGRGYKIARDEIKEMLK